MPSHAARSRPQRDLTRLGRPLSGKPERGSIRYISAFHP
jgi:hypothetical protein